MTAINSGVAPSTGMAQPLSTDNPNPTDHSNAASSSRGDAVSVHDVPAQHHGVSVARQLHQIEKAWELVYHTYADQGLIHANDHQVHTVHEAIHPSTAVVVQEDNDRVISTLTIMQDRRHGLPLDCVYPAEMNRLRSTGRRLVEIGLLAETASKQGSSARGIIEMMRHVFWFAWHHKAFILAGVHPKHAGFYCRFFGFEPIGEPSTHPTVNHWPVVPLCCPLDEMLASPPWPKGVGAFVNAPMPLNAFKHRARLTEEFIADSRIGAYMEEKADQLAIRAA